MNQPIVKESLDVALLPLADGRRLIMPLVILAEVKQMSAISSSGGEYGLLEWRGHTLKVETLDSFCGLASAETARYTTIGVFRADRDAGQSFRALAFCGTAAHGQVDESRLQMTQLPETGHFLAAAEMEGNSYLVPDLAKLLAA